MNLNSFIFPKQKTINYNKNDKNLIFIQNKIPCMFIKNKLFSDKIILYFHGNSEDIGNSKNYLENICNKLDINGISVEYPSYGIYNEKISEKQILKDSVTVYNFLVNKMGFKESNIIIMGFSIGSGPATYLASIKEKSLGLVLISPFLSIKKAIKDKLGFLSFFVKDKFKNYKNIGKVQISTIIIHGMKDNIINCSHSKKLIEICNSNEKKFVNPSKMSHTDFLIESDIIIPIKEFFNTKLQKNYKNKINFDFILNFN